VPLPCTVLVIAAGAFARQGILPWHTTALISIISVVIGDAISYSFGFYAREKVLNRFSDTPRWKQAEETFRKWGPLSIFFSRFLVTAIALPVTLLSGTTRFPFKKWLTYDATGETVWISRLRRAGLSIRQPMGSGQRLSKQLWRRGAGCAHFHHRHQTNLELAIKKTTTLKLRAVVIFITLINDDVHRLRGRDRDPVPLRSVRAAHHFDIEMQFRACQRMVEIKLHCLLVEL
jgi:membrane protein DedA with SNARE-associated domain